MNFYQSQYGEYFEEDVNDAMSASGKKSQKTKSKSPKRQMRGSMLPGIAVPPAKHFRTSLPVDVIDPVHYHLDPISVSLQERVKVGGHITSVTKKPYHKVPFYFILSEVDPRDHITKRSILSHEIEYEENKDSKRQCKRIKDDKQDNKA